MSKPFRMLIKHESGNTGPGEIVSAGYTDFNPGEHYDPSTHSVVEQPRIPETGVLLKTKNKTSFDYWDGVKLIKQTRSQASIDSENIRFILSDTPGPLLAWEKVIVKGGEYWRPLYGPPVT